MLTKSSSGTGESCLGGEMGWVGVGVGVSGGLVVAASASVSVVGRTGAVSGIIRVK